MRKQVKALFRGISKSIGAAIGFNSSQPGTANRNRVGEATEQARALLTKRIGHTGWSVFKYSFPSDQTASTAGRSLDRIPTITSNSLGAVIGGLVGRRDAVAPTATLGPVVGGPVDGLHSGSLG
jgi:hypothetical protein